MTRFLSFRTAYNLSSLHASIYFVEKWPYNAHEGNVGELNYCLACFCSNVPCPAEVWDVMHGTVWGFKVISDQRWLYPDVVESSKILPESLKFHLLLSSWYIAWPWVDSIWAPTQEGCSTASKEASKMHCLFFFLLKVVRSGSVPLLFKWKCYLKYLILPSVGGREGGCFVVVVCF